MSQLFVDIALPLPLDHVFTYIVPPELQSSVSIGKRVLVPFGKKHYTGVVVAMSETTKVRGLKPVTDILDVKPAFSKELLALTNWISEYYLNPWGETLKAATPQGLSQESKKVVCLIFEEVNLLLEQTKQSAPKQNSILKILSDFKPILLNTLRKKSKIKNIYSVLNEMQNKGWISIEEEITKPKVKPKLSKFISLKTDDISNLKTVLENHSLTKKQRSIIIALLDNQQDSNSYAVEIHRFMKQNIVSLASIKSLEKKGILKTILKEVIRSSEYENIEQPQEIILNANQKYAYNEICSAISSNKFNAFLLHGITGSGKTQVYIDAIKTLLLSGKTAIVLVPEISLTPQTVRRFKAHFGNDVAVMHSQMSAGERYDAWRLAHEEKIKIVIGPRSAIFAPLKNIGLIVVDEEHDSSYKQYDSTPRYNARDVAVIRALQTNAVVVLGSATPSIESYFNAINGKYTLLELPQRIDTAKLPTIEIVDMAKEKREIYNDLKEEIKKSGKQFPKRLPYTSISRLLQTEITERLQKKEGIILLQNRRGFSHVMECFDCGYVEKCDNCDVSLTFHVTKKHLRCHYCGYVKKPPSICPKCNGIEIRMYAFGTQQVQEELQALFPVATILRMDRDTTSHKGAHDKILNQFGMGEADILLGTQMVAKGLDFPRVTLVGVISADTQMLLPDFRSSEGTFQLLTQVSGRAGRSTLEGEVIIQTLQPDHYSLKHVLTHNYRGFYQEEIEYRRELDYPPFSRIVLLEFSGEKENEVQHHAKKFTEYLELFNKQNKYIVLGPADAAISKLKNVYRKHVLIKDLKKADPSGAFLRADLLKAKQRYEASPIFSKKVKLTLDVDPQGMM